MPRLAPERVVETDQYKLILGDCREILSSLKCDSIVTDPPYGIAEKWQGGESSKHGWKKVGKEKTLRNLWDSKPSKETIDLLLKSSKQQIIWGGNYFELPLSRCWYVWNKPERGFTLAEAELAWTNKDSIVRVFDGPRTEGERFHPTQKPVSLMVWCIDKVEGNIADPFMGSGTTGVACMRRGRYFIGVEAEEEYFNLALERIEKERLNPQTISSVGRQKNWKRLEQLLKKG